MLTKKNLPIAIILIGVVLAAGLALSLRKGSTEKPVAPSPVAVTNKGGGHVRGKPEARVTLVEYGDFQCPSCAFYHPIIEGLLSGSSDLVKLEFHHFPLIQMHKNAFSAALAAEAAADQGKFFEMYDLLFQSQSTWSEKTSAEEDFLVMAQKLGLDSNKFLQSMRAPETRDRVIQDVTRGQEANVQGTPSFFVDGRPIHPLPTTVQGFKDAIMGGYVAK